VCKGVAADELPDELPPAERFLERIRERVDAGLKQDELASLSGINQRTISARLNSPHGLQYDEAKRLVDALKMSASHIPQDFAVKQIESKWELETTSLQSSLKVVTDTMSEKGFSQLPVLDEDGRYVGLISEMSVLRFLLSPRPHPSMLKGLTRLKSLDEFRVGDLRVKRITHNKMRGKSDAPGSKAHGMPKNPEPRLGFLEPAPMVSPDEPLRKAAVKMVHYYAVVLGESESELEGIVTRADFLKLEKLLKKSP